MLGKSGEGRAGPIRLMAPCVPWPAKPSLQSPHERIGGLSWVVVGGLLAVIMVASASGEPQIVTYRPVHGSGTSGGKFVVPCEYHGRTRKTDFWML